ncbi:MAG: hypothetical protein KKH75_01275 [Actinobacteria bacterium]|nr:hypothetical protein [Actinomycetota bacterium]
MSLPDAEHPSTDGPDQEPRDEHAQTDADGTTRADGLPETTDEAGRPVDNPSG